MTYVHDYASAVATLGGRSERRVTPGSNNTLHRVWSAPSARGDDGPTVALRYHATDVITWYPDGTVDLVCWDSVTTRRRFDDFLSGVRVGTESGFQHLTYRGARYGVGHYGRVTLHPDGTVTGDVMSESEHADRVRDHRREMARAARARRKLERARADASARLAAVRAVFGSGCDGYVVAHAHAFAAVSMLAQYAGHGDGYGRGVRVSLRRTDHLAAMQRERDAIAGRMLAGARAAFGFPFTSTVVARERARLAWCAARDAFGAAFAWSVRERDAARWLAANRVPVDGRGFAWLAKRVRRDGRGHLVSGFSRVTRWESGAVVVPDRWEPGAWCGAGLHACATDRDAATWVHNGPNTVRIAVKVRAVDIVTDDAHGIGGGIGGKVKVPRVYDVAVTGPARRAVLGSRA